MLASGGRPQPRRRWRGGGGLGGQCLRLSASEPGGNALVWYLPRAGGAGRGGAGSLGAGR